MIRLPALIGAGVAVAALTLAPALPAAAATPTKSCSASVSNSRPVQNSNVTVTVRGVYAATAITTVAHYKTTNTAHSFRSAANGVGSTVYAIGRATHGYKVVVSVTATKGTTHWSCSTSFTTR